MIWDDVYLSSAAVWLGEKEDVKLAVSEGRYDAEEQVEDDFLAMRVAPDVAPPDMAVQAAERALERSGADRDSFALVVHASVGFQGADHWSPAPYIQSRTVGGNGSAVEVKQASNGGLAALELAAGYLSAQRGPASALVTTADRYSLPSFDRYRSDKGLPRGDGGTALVLTRGAGVARLLSTSIVSDTTHEALYRGPGPLHDLSGADGWPVDIRKHRQAYLDQGIDIWELIASVNARQQEAIQTALKDAGVDSGEIARWVFPFAGRGVVDWELRKRDFGIEEERTTWDWGRTVGHLGAGDQAAGIVRLLETGAVRPGDKVVLAGIGAGFYLGCAVLEITETPDWTVTAD
ncbi:ketoacyl-ACP synthase III family protein [Streptomyces beijiangensis]|uniref:Ketoacyl-ACP synthase III family protein n=1 Tax=Streptomyces beijiangensis TaxID=163361 RepID=A0A939FB01_9ACTN|nr:ketoacyl-ACP synthase III family protein [Streptomyces beijiangensis]MBO0514152.1 ketoacyl-ACP synthase III family protein [Streptomyces beijiangensis]